MKTLYYNYIEYVIGQAADAAFAKDLYEGYRIRFIDIKEILVMIMLQNKDLDVFFERLRESLKITLNNLEKVELFQFYFIEDLAPSDENEGLQDVFFLMWDIFFPDENWQDENYKNISFEIDRTISL